MLKTLLIAALTLTALPALAQESAVPPAVSTDAPAQGQAAPQDDTAPIMTPDRDASAQPGPALADSPAAAAAATSAPPPATPAAAAVETDLTSLVRKAHPVVQAVMALLAAAVFAVLTVFLFKLVEFQIVFGRLRRSAHSIEAAEGVAPVAGDDPLALSARAAADELAALPAHVNADLRASARERLDLSLEQIEAGAVQQLRAGTGLLASIGSVSPFIGLFGTVFGIMNSFLAIAATKTTNLAVVAPGIAEALLATGIGLVAAIPAVLLYNRTMRRIAAFRHALADGRAEVLRRFSRALDARMGG